MKGSISEKTELGKGFCRAQALDSTGLNASWGKDSLNTNEKAKLPLNRQRPCPVLQAYSDESLPVARIARSEQFRPAGWHDSAVMTTNRSAPLYFQSTVV